MVVREESLGADQTLVHVTYPPDTTVNAVEKFGDRLQRELPKGTKIVLTHPGVQIKVNRPRHLKLTITANKIESGVLLEQLKELTNSPDIQTASVVIQNNEIVERSTKPRKSKPAPPKKKPVAGKKKRESHEKGRWRSG
jgi:cell division GTPase FtsZ